MVIIKVAFTPNSPSFWVDTASKPKKKSVSSPSHALHLTSYYCHIAPTSCRRSGCFPRLLSALRHLRRHHHLWPRATAVRLAAPSQSRPAPSTSPHHQLSSLSGHNMSANTRTTSQPSAQGRAPLERLPGNMRGQWQVLAKKLVTDMINENPALNQKTCYIQPSGPTEGLALLLKRVSLLISKPRYG